VTTIKSDDVKRTTGKNSFTILKSEMKAQNNKRYVYNPNSLIHCPARMLTERKEQKQVLITTDKASIGTFFEQLNIGYLLFCLFCDIHA